MNQYIGRLLDNRYEILEILGTGGMAVVYKALCHRLNRLVAVKILKDEFSGDEEFRRRFRAEGEAVAMLSHPNIVQVFDVSSSDNANYIVMELIDGISLKQYMEAKGVLNWKETLHFAMQIAKGLEHAHSRGIVHRDIKPHNVMVLKDGSVKVMDFGIARVMSKSNTLTKEALGSVHYISPEQAKGGYTDSRSDIYSLGVVMYEMMAGRPPFDGESPVAVAIQHINGGAPLPTSFNPNIPQGMEQIIMKAMSLDPKDRYASASEMLQDMEEFRKNPAIAFDYAAPVVSAHAAAQVPPRNTAERIAKAKNGTVNAPKANTGKVRSGVNGDTSRSKAAAMASASSGKNADAVRRAQQRRREEERQKERSRVATLAVIACSAVAVIAIFVFLVAVFNGALLNQERELVEVPYLVGQEYSDDMITLYKDFTIRFQPQQYDSTYKKGEIMHQEPAGGSKVYKGTEIVITVSLGEEPDVKLMEQLAGVTLEEAKSFLTGQEFNTLTFSEPSDTVPEGKIIRTDPAEGTVLKDHQTIKIWVSTGPEVILKIMPDVMGMDKETALQVLNQLGFENVVCTTVESNRPKGEVVYQSERRKTELDVRTEIMLEISEGPVETTAEPETEPPTTETAEPPTTLPPETTAPAGEEKTLMVRFSIPVKSEPYMLTILQDKNIIAKNVEIPAGNGYYEVQITDSGVKEYQLYVNDDLYVTQRVTFNG